MKQTRKKTEKIDEPIKTVEVKKSKIRLYWEDQERRGIPPGVIHNMRAVLR